MPGLWPQTLRPAPPPLHAAARARPQGQRRVRRPALPRPSPRRASRRKRTQVVEGDWHRAGQGGAHALETNAARRRGRTRPQRGHKGTGKPLIGSLGKNEHDKRAPRAFGRINSNGICCAALESDGCDGMAIEGKDLRVLLLVLIVALAGCSAAPYFFSACASLAPCGGEEEPLPYTSSQFGDSGLTRPSNVARRSTDRDGRSAAASVDGDER